MTNAIFLCTVCDPKTRRGSRLNCKFFKFIYFVICIVIFSPLAIASSIPSIEPNEWDLLTNEFSLDHEVQHPEVQKQIKKILKHPEDLEKITQQAKPYLYHILQEIKKRNLPGELALIPMIESEYDPFVKSSAGAAGLWQLMPHTSVELGIPKSWWVDGRRSIGPSTDAALNYLAYLHQFFHGNWKLAVAAYDSGPSRVSRAVKHNGKKSHFWSLSLPHETKAYIPHLLALSEIIQHPARYNVQLPQIPHKPYFKEVEVDKHVKPIHAAKLAEVPTKDFRRLNPGFKDWTKPPSHPYKLLIPTEHVDDFYRNLANISDGPSKKKPVKLSFLPQTPLLTMRYTARKGDSLNRIAHRHHIKLSALKRLNPKVRRGRVKPGQQIILG